MTIQEITHAFQVGGRMLARYRDEYGFIIHGVILGIEGDKIFIDNKENIVSIDRVISIKHI